MIGGQEELFESLFSASPDAVVVADRDGCIVLASPSVTALFGYEPKELEGRPVEDLVPGELRTRHVRHRQAFADTPAPRPMGAGLQLKGRRKDGTVFPIDVSLAPTRSSGKLLVGAYIRDATERQRSENLLRFVNDVSHQALTGMDVAAMLELTCERARDLVSAAAVWVALPQESGSHDLEVVAAQGEAGDRLRGALIPKQTSLAWVAMIEGRPVIVDDLQSEERGLPEARQAGLGPAVYLPMQADGGPVGALVAARDAGATGFDGAETSALQGFAAATAVVTELARARELLERMRLLGEQERIARDLHDSVIQRLFALGMQLQATERVAEAGPMTDRIRSAVETIDEVIREIRETIFDLSHPSGSSQEVRRNVREVVHEATEQLDFAPRVSFRGPVESTLSELVTAQLLSVLREALTNCCKHARAGAIDVVVTAEQGWITLTVADDGVGIDEGPTAGNGLANLRSRAEAMGGSFSATRRRPSGTLVQWRVPAEERG